MNYTILDCYTDEPSGLGVPPYLGTYPRYIYGLLKSRGNNNIKYVTIDDLRLLKKYSMHIKKISPSQKTNIKIYNLTINHNKIREIIEETDILIAIMGVHVPGKYLSAVPGTMKEAKELLKDIKCKKILTGPVIFGTQLEGGKFFEKFDQDIFDDIKSYEVKYDKLRDIAIKGAEIIKQIPQLRIIEIETGHGCKVGKCSFCTEPIKNKVENRNVDDIILEIKKFYELGQRYFRIGKQACFYSYPEPILLLKRIRKECPKIKVLHIDNVNPIFVNNSRGAEITKAIAKYCTSGNVAALGVESFDMEVIKKNDLVCKPEVVMKAVKIINKYGATRGDNGMPKFLPGINLIFGLLGETKKSHDINLHYLKKILDEGLLLRRINIRQAAIFKGTKLYVESRKNFIFKNKRYYWKWRRDIREKIDNMMLKRLLPVGTILKDVRTEIYDGNTTFGRQIGTYPLIVGVKKRLEIGKFYSIKVNDYMLRSISGEPIEVKPHQSQF